MSWLSGNVKCELPMHDLNWQSNATQFYTHTQKKKSQIFLQDHLNAIWLYCWKSISSLLCPTLSSEHAVVANNVLGKTETQEGTGHIKLETWSEISG